MSLSRAFRISVPVQAALVATGVSASAGLVTLVALLLACGCSAVAGLPEPSRPEFAGSIAELGVLLPPPPPKPACRAAATGELVVNEYLVRPGGIDLDGDGKSTLRDESIEFAVDSDEPVHVLGAEWWVDGVRRAKVTTPVCLPPQRFAVLVGNASGKLVLGPGAIEVRLDRSLRLTDAGSHLELRSPQGQVIAHLEYAAEPHGVPAATWVRALDGERGSPFVRHDALPAGTGAPHSLGTCATGQPACECLGAQGMDCPELARAATTAQGG
ncbi:MAG: hypothetical protein EXR79_04395 [Myxococcales bacterium]|nr:hypothetical protein [Myxococcales bacterium]